MLINPIVTHLRATCPAFAGRIAAGIDWDAVANSAQLSHPSAYVIATGDQASANDLQNAVRQNITDEIDVVIVLDTSDERGQAANDLLHIIRSELWRALVGWRAGPDYDVMEYDGGALVHINRARVIYRYGFSAAFQLGRNLHTDPPETWHEWETDGLPGFTGITVNMDCIDPADPNLQFPGPDGRIEVKFSGDVTP
jgi:hypothetical protein